VSLDAARALDADDPLAAVRDRFAIPEGVIYLDGNSLGAMPKEAPDRVGRTVAWEWGEDLITSWNRHGWIDWPERLAARLAPIVGAGEDELLVCDSTSVNLFKLVVAALMANPARHVILTEQGNFPTDLYVAQGITRLFPHVALRAVPRDQLEHALGPDVALLMLTHIDYRSGWRHHMAALNAAAWDCGALSLWDLSHSAGAMRIDLAASGADLAVGCGYKFLNGGPGAPAWLFVRRDLQARLDNPIAGWMGHEAPFAFDGTYSPASGIKRFLSGTPPVIGLAALEAGLATFDGVDIDEVETKAADLTQFLIAAVAERCPGLALASPPIAHERGAHVVFDHRHAYAIVQALIARGVVGDYREPGLVRFGLAPLTTRFEDVWRAVDALADVIDSEAYMDERFAERAAVT
jgi:kynureninase